MHTTDSQSEIFDIVDEKDNVIGKATRGEVHKNRNLIHRSIGVVVFNSKGKIFLQQRSATKDTDPLKWTMSCSGHVISGDDYLTTAIRELREELGILYKGTPCSSARGPLEKVNQYLCQAPNETEIQMLYKTTCNGPFKLHTEEIARGKFFTRKELNHQLKSGKLKLSFMGKIAMQKIGYITLDK